MTDIYDIKPLFLWFFINFLYTLIFLIFFSILYFLFKTPKKIKKEEKKEKKYFKKIDFNKVLENFEKKYLMAKKDIFYSKLAEILKEILKENKNVDISKMTYKEFSKINLENSLLKLLKNIYFKEYAKNIEDNKNLRENLILEIKKLI